MLLRKIAILLVACETNIRQVTSCAILKILHLFIISTFNCFLPRLPKIRCIDKFIWMQYNTIRPWIFLYSLEFSEAHLQFYRSAVASTVGNVIREYFSP